jgi:sugar diacid utilization regulator
MPGRGLLPPNPPRTSARNLGLTEPDDVATTGSAAESEALGALISAALTAARGVEGVASALLLSWADGSPRIVGQHGIHRLRMSRRHPAGVHRIAELPVIVTPVNADDDLVVVGHRHGPEFKAEHLETIQSLATLVRVPNGRHHQLQTSPYGIATRVAAPLEPRDAFVAIADAASQLAGAEVAGLLLVEGDKLTMRMRCVLGNSSVEATQLRISSERGVVGSVLAEGKPARVDYSSGPRADEPDRLGMAAAEGATCALYVPLVADQDKIGVLGMWRRRRPSFDAHDEQLMVGFAQLASVVISNARRYENKRAAASELAMLQADLALRNQVVERALRTHDELTRIAGECEDLDSLVARMHGVLDGAVAVIGDDGQVLAECPLGTARMMRATVARSAASPAERTRPSGRLVESAEGRVLALAPVRAYGVDYGQLCVALDNAPNASSVTIAERAATLCALLVAREDATLMAGRRALSEFLWDLLEGRHSDEATVILRARHLGQGIVLPARVVLVNASALDDKARSEAWSAQTLDRTRADLSKTLARCLRLASSATTLSARRGDTMAFVVGSADYDPRRLLTDLNEALEASRPTGGHLTAGVSGSVTSLAELPRAHREAQFALSAADFNQHPVELFDHLGVLQLLLAPSGRKELENFAHRVLGDIMRYDEEHGSGLIKTLEAYVAAGGSLQDSASALYVHPKTVGYRMRRITEIGMIDFADPEQLLNVQLALKILKL